MKTNKKHSKIENTKITEKSKYDQKVRVQENECTNILESYNSPLFNTFVDMTDDFYNSLENLAVYNNYNINVSIDSIHITTKLNPFDIEKKELTYLEVFDTNKTINHSFDIKTKDKKYITNYKINISKDNQIKVRYHKLHQIYTYEFGGLSQYKDINKTKLYILREVYRNLIAISRIDVAVDSFSDFNDFKVFPTLGIKKDDSKGANGLYLNSYYSGRNSKFTCYIYDKTYTGSSLANSIYSKVTRIELRLFNRYLTCLDLKKLLCEPTNHDKFQDKVIKEISNMRFIYDNKRVNLEDLKVKDILLDFIEFLESNTKIIKVNHYKKFNGEIEKQKTTIDKIKTFYKVKNIDKVKNMYRQKKLSINQISSDTGIHRKTIAKIVKISNVDIL